MRNRLLLALLLASAPAFAQLENHTLTISASRQVLLQPDQVVFSLTVSSGTSTTLDQIIAALSPLNITSASLTGISNYEPATLEWNFILTAPLSKLTATIASLTPLQQSIGQNNSGLTLAFNIAGTQASPELQQAQSCSTSDLIADATGQAQKLAAAAGMTLGPIVKLSNGPSSQSSSGLLGYVVPAPILLASISDFLLGAAPSPVTCAATVQFQLRP